MIHEVFIYLRVKNGAKAIEFYKQAFGASEIFRLTEPGGRLGHAELDFGGTTIMVSDEFPEMNILGPESIGGSSAGIHLHVDNADACIQQALSAGATLVMEPTDQFYGERSGAILDPFGHRWLIGHSIEELDPAEMQRRYDALFSKSD